VSLTPVPDGHLAAEVTYLEMREPPAQSTVPASNLVLEGRDRPDLEFYRSLFRLVGAPWLWFSRLILDDPKLASIIHDSRVELYCVLADSGDEVGIVELDFRVAGECELAFIGLVPGLTGQGHGRWLLAEALRLAWRDGITRVHVHTCSLDHPAALAAYRRAGFTAIGRAIETFPDPRLSGLLPRDCAPQIPLTGSAPASCV
jgi:GNAT superfamily N-acetyltransferase